MGSDFIQEYYRFYGARHSPIHKGFKIDYEEQIDTNRLPKIRNILHLHEEWLSTHSKFFIWQQFIDFLYTHLKQTSILEPFYFEVLDSISKHFYTQNPKRVILEHYIKLLEFEGQWSYPFICKVCHSPITDTISFAKGLKPLHIHCYPRQTNFEVKDLEGLARLKNSFELSDDMVTALFKLLF